MFDELFEELYNNVVGRNCQLVIGEDEEVKEEAGETRKREPF